MPKAMNTGQARVIDPILSTHAVGYTNGETIAHELFPFVNIPQRAAKIIRFGKESFRLLNTRRAPGANKKRVQYGYDAGPVGLYSHDLEGIVSEEEAAEAAVPGINLASGAINMVLDVILLELEVNASSLATDANSFAANNKMALSGADKWSDDDSDPEADMLAAREAVRKRIGRYPNKLVLGANVFARLVSHPKIKAHFKYTTANSVTEEMLARLFRVEKVVVGKSVYLPEDVDDDADALDVWPDTAILAYVPSTTNYRVPSFGYTYRKTGHPNVKVPYWEDNCDSWIYPVKYEWNSYHTAIDAGFLFQNVM